MPDTCDRQCKTGQCCHRCKTQDGKEFNNQLLEECTDQLWLTGAMVLDANGNIVGEYSESGDRSRFAKIQEHVNKETILDIADHEEKV